MPLFLVILISLLLVVLSVLMSENRQSDMRDILSRMSGVSQ